MQFFTDENVPDSVGDAIIASGHDVTRARDVLPQGSSDDIVAIMSAENGFVLVSFDRDFRAVARRLGVSQHQHRKLHRIDLRCDFPEGVERMTVAMSFIEHEWTIAAHRGAPMVIAISSTQLRVER